VRTGFDEVRCRVRAFVDNRMTSVDIDHLGTEQFGRGPLVAGIDHTISRDNHPGDWRHLVELPSPSIKAAQRQSRLAVDESRRTTPKAPGCMRGGFGPAPQLSTLCPKQERRASHHHIGSGRQRHPEPRTDPVSSRGNDGQLGETGRLLVTGGERNRPHRAIGRPASSARSQPRRAPYRSRTPRDAARNENRASSSHVRGGRWK